MKVHLNINNECILVTIQEALDLTRWNIAEVCKGHDEESNDNSNSHKEK